MSPLVSDFGAWMMAKGYLSPASADAYTSDISQFEKWLIRVRANYHWSMVTKSDIEDYIDYLRGSDYEYSSICRALSSLSSFFEYFVSNGKLAVNPLAHVRRPRPSYHTREALDMDIIRKVLAQPHLTDQTRALIALISESGLRLGECQAMRLDDINFEYRQIRVKGKGRTYRMVYFGECAAKYLSAYVRGRRFSGSIFPLSRRQYNWDVYHACKPFAGEHKCSPHILRHTFATESLNNGLPMDVLMLTLGHRSIDTTMLYTHCQTTRTESENRKYSARL